LLNID